MGEWKHGNFYRESSHLVPQIRLKHSFEYHAHNWSEKSKSVYNKMLKIVFMTKLNLIKNHFLLVVFSIFILASLSLFAGAIPGVRCKQSLSSWMVEICNKFWTHWREISERMRKSVVCHCVITNNWGNWNVWISWAKSFHLVN